MYADVYGINEATTIIRGTLRYKGYTDNVKGLVHLGLLSPEPHPFLHEQGPPITWRQLTCRMLGAPDDTFYDNLLELVAERVGGGESRLKAMVDLGLVAEQQVERRGTPLDTLSKHLADVLKYGRGERDMILLRHEVNINWPDGRKEERGINLVCYGSGEPGGFTAMAKTVGYPCAIAARMVMDKEIQEKGMVLPMKKDIYNPMIMRLETEDIRATETSKYF